MTNKSVYQSFLWEIMGQVQQVFQMNSCSFVSEQKLLAVMLGTSEHCLERVRTCACRIGYNQKHGLGQKEILRI